MFFDFVFNGVNIFLKLLNDEYNVIKGSKGGGFGIVFLCEWFYFVLKCLIKF